MEKEILNLIEKLCECQAMCKYCFNACLEEENVHMLVKCIKYDVECAEICGMAISSLSYEGGFAKDFLRLCVDACEKCARECRKHDHLHCIECAKACEDCARACREFI